MKTNKIFNILSVAAILLNCAGYKVEAQTKDTIQKTGILTSDETWSGVIHVVNGGVTVPEGITLTIKPGTVCLFESDRNYQTFNRARLTIDHGTLRAIGTPDSMIWFTSDDPSPINGDWGCIHIDSSNNSMLIYTIIEFAQLGIEHFYSYLTIRNSIVRFNNIEGIYAEHSRSILESNTCYKNTYHDIAMENFNDTMMINHNKFGPGNQSIVFQQSKGVVEKNYFTGYSGVCLGISVFSWAQVDSNHFDHLPNPFYVDDGSSIDSAGNNCGIWSEYVPVFDYPDTVNHSLSYIPGDTNDLYPYVYDQVDNTRRYLKRVGKDLHFGWAIGYFNGYLWKLDTPFLYRIDTATGEVTEYKNSPLISGPGGLTHDGQYFWAYEKNNRQIYKFEILADSVHVLDYFAAPDSGVNRALGLTTDGTYLYQKSLILPALYKIDKNGNVIDSIDFSGSNVVPDSYVVWADGSFWGPCPTNSIGKWSETGQFLGSFYQVAFGTEAMCYDGHNFWTLQKTCELWNDDKIFKIEVLSLINSVMDDYSTKNDIQIFNVFPIPAKDILIIELYEAINTSVEIMSLEGKLIEKYTFQDEKTQINIENLSSGFYVLKAKNEKGIQVIKLIKH